MRWYEILGPGGAVLLILIAFYFIADKPHVHRPNYGLEYIQEGIDRCKKEHKVPVVYRNKKRVYVVECIDL